MKKMVRDGRRDVDKSNVEKNYSFANYSFAQKSLMATAIFLLFSAVTVTA